MSGERIFIFGIGYAATAFAHAARADAEWIRGTVREPGKVAPLARDGITARIFDGTKFDPAIATDIAAATHVIVSTPPGTGDPVIAHFADSLRSARDVRWLAYLSSVAVYGNYGGAWVTERTTPHPSADRAIGRLAAEREWTALATQRGLPLAILRLAGIYGPGRNAFVNLAEGKAHRAVKSGQVFNRVDVDDIVAALAAAMQKSAAGIFNVTDDLPAPPQDVVAYAADLMGVSAPPEVPYAAAELSPMARSFYADNKRVKNLKLKQELGVALRYPTYREGLAALWRSGAWK